MTAQDLPVLILGYLRFDGISRILKSCSDAGISLIYLAVDGAKDSEGLSAQDESLQKIYDLAVTLSVTLLVRRRHSNAGLAVGVVEGITWFFQHEEFGVILEDDLVISPSFFDFVAEARSKFEKATDVAVISGNNYFALESNRSISASHYPLIWGWATWRDVWSEFTSSLEISLSPKFNRQFSLIVNAFWFTAANQSRLGKVDSWAMSFSHHIKMRGRICISPPQNLVSNQGADSVAIHSNENDIFVNFPLVNFLPRSDWAFPSKAQMSQMDKVLENRIFSIRTRHILSPMKLALQLLVPRAREKLICRINNSAVSADYSILRRGK